MRLFMLILAASILRDVYPYDGTKEESNESKESAKSTIEKPGALLL